MPKHLAYGDRLTTAVIVSSFCCLFVLDIWPVRMCSFPVFFSYHMNLFTLEKFHGVFSNNPINLIPQWWVEDQLEQPCR